MRAIAVAPVVVLIAASCTVFLLAQNTAGGPVTPTIAAAAAVIAVTSLSVTAVTSYANWVRGQRQSTLTAWSEWVEETKEARTSISSVIGVNAGLTYEQGKAVCQGTGFVARGAEVSADDSKELRRHLRAVLAGLERLAVGVEQMVYDRDLLMEIGGTIVVTTHARFLTYIIYTQENPDADKRRPFAYIALGALIAEVESEEGKARRDLFDQVRLRRIRQTVGNGRRVTA